MVSESPKYPFRRPPELDGPLDAPHPVVIVGAGPVGLTAALTLAHHGIRCVVLEDDDAVCSGSRALGMSRRTLEIWDGVNAVEAIAAHGCAWHSGRSFYRGNTVLEFRMPDDAALKYRPMFNIQQCHTENYLVRALDRSGLAALRWQSRLVGLEQKPQGVSLEVDTPQGRYRMDARWVIACDGARSAVRSALGLKMEGTSYEAAYVIADIKLDTDAPMERRCWFDPPSNPGSTILMHGQPEGVWRLDYQLREGEDAESATRPENVLPRIQSHLDFIGERGEWSLQWASMYRVHSRALADFRHGRIFFAGDAAHLMPIFGIRGLNSGVEDAWNVAWKLAYVEKGLAPDRLLDSYSAERHAVFRENAALAERNAWFMTPPTAGARVIRDAVLTLASSFPEVQDIINPKQASYVPLRHSPLSSEDDPAFRAGPAPGDIVPDVKLAIDGYFHDLLDRHHFTGIYFAASSGVEESVNLALSRLESEFPLQRLVVSDRGLHARFGAVAGTFYLVRPDHHVAGRWSVFDAAAVRRALGQALCVSRVSAEVRTATDEALLQLTPAERVYRALGKAMGEIAPERQSTFLAELALLLSLRLDDPGEISNLVEAAKAAV